MSDAKPIATFCKQKRDSDVAVLLGKGPSLDAYADRPPEATYVLGLNETPTAIECDGAIYGDRLIGQVPYPEDIDILRYKHAHLHDGRGYVYLGPKDVPESDPRCIPAMGNGLCCDAVTILHLWGIRRLLLWGFDSMYREADSYDSLYAKRIRPHLIPNGNKRWKYRHRGEGLRCTLDHYGMEWIHHG